MRLIVSVKLGSVRLMLESRVFCVCCRFADTLNGELSILLSWYEMLDDVVLVKII